MSSLFRKPVLDKIGKKMIGDVILASPISHWLMTCLLATIIIGVVTFAIVAEYSRKERVVGYLVPNAGLIRVVPQQVGIIEEIHVANGQKIKKGEQLFTVKIDTVFGNGKETAATLLIQLAEAEAAGVS